MDWMDGKTVPVLRSAIILNSVFGYVLLQHSFQRCVEFGVEIAHLVHWPYGVDGFVQFRHLFADRAEGDRRNGRLDFPRRQIALRHLGQHGQQFALDFGYVIRKILSNPHRKTDKDERIDFKCLEKEEKLPCGLDRNV